MIVAWLLCMPSWAVSRDWYVATNATPAPPYDSWATGYTIIQDALDVAGDGDTVYLAGHTFLTTNQIRWIGGSSVTLSGG